MRIILKGSKGPETTISHSCMRPNHVRIGDKNCGQKRELFHHLAETFYYRDNQINPTGASRKCPVNYCRCLRRPCGRDMHSMPDWVQVQLVCLFFFGSELLNLFRISNFLNDDPDSLLPRLQSYHLKWSEILAGLPKKNVQCLHLGVLLTKISRDRVALVFLRCQIPCVTQLRKVGEQISKDLQTQQSLSDSVPKFYLQTLAYDLKIGPDIVR